ncbi:MAG TPA: cysteine peptidase family C39 domain-containing protein [Chloroflexota bacterium]|jgi:ABC-type bacteriocin/lantibiotic exporter with double-glycine peptidase domain|nr:cysteine peptidase family C39 domain-containing protein [Chloroflexota bacterium]
MRRRIVACAGLLLIAGLLSPAVVSADPWYHGSTRRVLAEPVYRTQRDGSRYAASNCGPAALGMILDAYGVDLPTTELRRLTHTYQGTWPNRGGTALQHIAHVAEDFGLSSHGLYDVPDEQFHRWTLDEVANQLRLGRWVIPLVRYNLLPGHEGGVRFGHYIVLYRVAGDGFLYDDPAYDPVEQGGGRWISREQLDRAMDPVLVPRQAVALGD